MSWLRRLVNLMRSDRVARDIDRELAFHLAEQIDELMEAGLSEAEARREARRRFGRPEAVRERVYDVDVLSWLETGWSDVLYALRALRARPGFTAVAVLSLALGIGANTAVFSLIDALMLRSLPVRQPQELVQLTLTEDDPSFTNPLWEAIRDRQTVLAGTFAFTDQSFDLSDGGVVRRVPGALVSGDYFEVLGVGAASGRLLGRADDVRGCAATAVLSHAFWQREYGGSADAIGRTLSLKGRPFEIVGVAAPGFSGIHVGRAAEVFAPLCALAVLIPDRNVLDARSTWFLNVFGRLRPDGGATQADAGLAALAPAVYAATVPEHWSADEQEEYRQGRLGAVPATTGMSLLRGEYREALFTLLVVVGVVLVVACANVAQLLLARATARRQEIAMRLALGSGRSRLVRQLLTESLVLAVLGAGLGLLFARWAGRLLVGFLADAGRQVSLDLSLDVRVLGFTIAVATATGLLFGLAPAWRSARVDLLAALRGAGRGLAGGRQRVARGIVVAQVALSLALVVAASLLVRSFGRLTSVDPGFRAAGVLLVEANWSKVVLDDEQRQAFTRRLIETVRGLPGVRQASASLLTPIGGSSWNEFVAVDGYTPRDPKDSLVWFNGVSDGYLETLGTRLVAGRDLAGEDRAGAPPVVLVNQALVDRFFGGEIPLGKSIRIVEHDQPGEPMEVVGVVGDAKYRRLDEEILPTAYRPIEQTELWGPSLVLELRTGGPPSASIPAVAAAMHDVDPAIALDVTTMSDQMAASIARPRLLATLSGFFGTLALLLAVIGLYGVMSYDVAQRRNEIGIRIALGAARRGILRLVAREVGLMIAVGLGLGALLALATSRLVASFLYGITVWDPVSLGFSALMLAAAAMLAGVVPAWRAAGIDPMEALREE